MDRLKKQGPLVLIVIVAILGAFLLGDVLSFDALARHRETLLAFREDHFVVAAGGFILAYVLIVTFSLPGATVATLTGGFLFGLLPGVIFNWMGAVLGATLIFLAARMGLGDRLAARLDDSAGMVQRMKQGLDNHQWSFLFLMRLVPAVPFFVANVVPAFLSVPLSRFVITTALGIIPGALVFTSVGAGLGDVFAAGSAPDLAVILEPFVLLPLLGLCALALLPVVIKVLRRETGR
ncbi:MAG: TVP38/TMEM64 family protein [Maritimibacter sp.]